MQGVSYGMGYVMAAITNTVSVMTAIINPTGLVTDGTKIVIMRGRCQ